MAIPAIICAITWLCCLGAGLREELVLDDINHRRIQRYRAQCNPYGQKNGLRMGHERINRHALSIGETGEEVFIGREWVQKQEFQ